MGNGFLDDIPELFEGDKRRRSARKVRSQKSEVRNQKSETKDDDSVIYPAVIYHVIKCPKCGSDNTKILTTKRPIRYHACSECGHGFRSIER